MFSVDLLIASLFFFLRALHFSRGRLLTLFIIFSPFLSIPYLRLSHHLRPGPRTVVSHQPANPQPAPRQPQWERLRYCNLAIPSFLGPSFSSTAHHLLCEASASGGGMGQRPQSAMEAPRQLERGRGLGLSVGRCVCSTP